MIVALPLLRVLAIAGIAWRLPGGTQSPAPRPVSAPAVPLPWGLR